MANAVSDDRITIPEDRSFSKHIIELSGQNVNACYQCGECTGGCPVAYAADMSPNQVSRLVQLGQEDAALGNSMIWLCIGCETCGTRCPRGVELAKVMDALRETAIERGVRAKEQNIKTFHETFLTSVEHAGRTHELSMLGVYKLRSGDLFSDLILGAKMFLKGKLALVPSIVWDRKGLKKMFSTRKK